MSCFDSYANALIERSNLRYESDLLFRQANTPVQRKVKWRGFYVASLMFSHSCLNGAVLFCRFQSVVCFALLSCCVTELETKGEYMSCANVGNA